MRVKFLSSRVSRADKTFLFPFVILFTFCVLQVSNLTLAEDFTMHDSLSRESEALTQCTREGFESMSYHAEKRENEDTNKMAKVAKFWNYVSIRLLCNMLPEWIDYTNFILGNVCNKCFEFHSVSSF